MRVAGGVIALISGILGIVAGLVTSFFGGFVTALDAQGAWPGIRVGLVGMAFSFLVIVYSVFVFVFRKRWPGCLVMAAAAGGIFIGGGLAAFCMVPASVGGALALLGRKSEKDPARQSRAPFIAAAVPLLVVTAISVGSPNGARHADDGRSVEKGAVRFQPARAGTGHASDPGAASAGSSEAGPAKGGSATD
ncbi:hypothetical protein [Rhodanobacter hydrolyticus]|uniref:MFS transporter n=1 Tax=Rhodanobacter hydrolyticus TaxID=2250595 RepID=A0ABW8J6Y3_9GAMM